MTSDEAPSSASSRSFPWGKAIALVAVLLTVGAAWYFFRDAISLDALIERETQLAAAREDRPVLATLIGFLVYVAVTALSIPGAAILTIAYGKFFGFLWATAIVSFASSSGATLAFLSSRYLVRDLVASRFGGYLERFQRSLDREGPFYLFSLRLIPAVPFVAINLAMGLTRMRTATFWWVSQLGMLPGTCVYVWAGASLPNLAELRGKNPASFLFDPQLLVAFALLAVFPWAVRFIMHRVRRPMEKDSDSHRPDEDQA